MSADGTERTVTTLWRLDCPAAAYSQCQSRIFRLKQSKLLQSPRERIVQKFKLKCQEMTGETSMSLAVIRRN